MSAVNSVSGGDPRISATDVTSSDVYDSTMLRLRAES